MVPGAMARASLEGCASACAGRGAAWKSTHTHLASCEHRCCEIRGHRRPSVCLLRSLPMDWRPLTWPRGTFGWGSRSWRSGPLVFAALDGVCRRAVASRPGSSVSRPLLQLVPRSWCSRPRLCHPPALRATRARRTSGLRAAGAADATIGRSPAGAPRPRPSAPPPRHVAAIGPAPFP